MNERGRKFQEERSWHDWYSALVRAIPPLTPDEYSAAIAALSAPKDSVEYIATRERLITSHLRQILSMAKDRPHYRLSVADYVGATLPSWGISTSSPPNAEHSRSS